MPKIKVNSTLKNNNNITIANTKGIIKNGKITFKDNEIMVIINKTNHTLEMNRNCEVYSLNLLFEKNKTLNGNYIINNFGNIPIKVETLNLSIKEKIIEVKYILYMNDNKEIFDYKLEYELI